MQLACAFLRARRGWRKLTGYFQFNPACIQSCSFSKFPRLPDMRRIFLFLLNRPCEARVCFSPKIAMAIFGLDIDGEPRLADWRLLRTWITLVFMSAASRDGSLDVIS